MVAGDDSHKEGTGHSESPLDSPTIAPTICSEMDPQARRCVIAWVITHMTAIVLLSERVASGLMREYSKDNCSPLFSSIHRAHSTQLRLHYPNLIHSFTRTNQTYQERR